MEILFLGTGDAMGSGGRFNTCFQVTTKQTCFLIDCGASSMVALRRFGVDPNGIRSIFITHLHGDHFAGLPFLLLDAQFYSKRRAPLTIAGPPGLKDRLFQAMELMFPGSGAARQKFELELIELEPRFAVRREGGEEGAPYVINGVTVTPFLVEHVCGAPPFAYRFECDGKLLAYTGDTQWCDTLIDCGRDADLLIAEALYLEKDIPWHLDYATLRAHLAEIAPKRVILTHMGPDMLAKRADLDCETAEDGLRVTI